MRLLIIFMVTGALTFGQNICAQAQSKRHAHPKESTGSICIAPPARPSAGEKSLANPAGGNSISTYAIQIDRRPLVIASNDEGVRISDLSLGGKHLVKIIGDGKVVGSFRFKFGGYRSKELCLWFNALYETWSLWEAKDGGTKCKCN